MKTHASLLPKSEQKYAQNFFKDRNDYEYKLKRAEEQLLDLQQSMQRKKRKLIIVLEGPDTAGKGGVIRRMARYLDPRAFQVHPIGAPNQIELQQHYLQRFFVRLPVPGQMTVFDRSWYGRVLVERVEKFATKNQWQRAYNEINQFEKMLTDDGIPVLKYLLDLSYKEQGQRFKERAKDPLTSWKLTKDDYRNRSKWTSYTKAYADMIQSTSTKYSPWNIVPADSKWYSRVTILQNIIKTANAFY